MSGEQEAAYACGSSHSWAVSGSRTGATCPSCSGRARRTRVRCPKCRRVLEAAEAVPAGEGVTCPGCGHEFVLGGAGAPAAGTIRPGTFREDVPPAPPPSTAFAEQAISLPGFRILATLGAGAMGVVYKARQEKLGRVVALKLLLAGPGATPKELEDFHDEAEAVARLKHPNIIQIFAVGEHEGRPYLVLEYVEGRTLADELGGAPQPARAAAALIATLARAAHTAHLCGIVHRDLKPANILLARQAAPPEGADADQQEAARRYGVPRIADFGLARRLGANSSVGEGQVVGTPLYMAPEQAEGRTDQTGPAADVYALGAILYEMLTGRPPFKAETVMGALLQVLTAEPAPPRSLRPGIAANLEAICLKCLKKPAHERYPSAEALAEDLQRFLNTEPVLARQAGLLERAWWWALRNPALTAVLAAAVGGGLFSFWYLGRVAESVVISTALRAVREEAVVIQESNLLYAEEAVGKVVSLPGQPLGVSTRLGEKNAVPLPATFSIELCNTVTRKKRDGRQLEARLYSAYPFKQRRGWEAGPQDDAQWDAWERLSGGEAEHFEVDRSGPGEPALRYFKAWKLTTAKCADCHNKHARLGDWLDARTGEPSRRQWKKGDVRGVLEVRYSLGKDLQATNETLWWTYGLLTGMVVALLALCGGALALGRQFR